MPLTEEQRRRLQQRIGQPLQSEGTPPEEVPPLPSVSPGTLPPSIAALAAQVPPGQPFIRQLGTRPTIAFPLPPAQVQQELGLEAAKQQVRQNIRSQTPVVGESTKRDFARIDAFEGILNDLSNLAKTVRKGPLRGRAVKVGAFVTGGGAFNAPEFAGGRVEATESENAVTYAQLRPAVARGLYRAITGDDRISDRDASQAALPFVPDFWLTDRAFAKRMRLIQKAVSRRRQSIRSSIRLGQSATPTFGSPAESQSYFLDVMSDVLSEELDEDDR